MYLICDGLARLLAPILPVTADDLWRHLPGRRSASVHLEEFPNGRRVRRPRAARRRGSRLLDVREAVNAALEQKRKDKVIGTSLGARVVIAASGPVGALLEQPSRRAADAVHRVGRRPDASGSTDGRLTSARRGREGARREVRALLAVRAQRPDRAGLGRHLRPLRRGAGRTGQLLT